jgi:hypothetical protein
VLGGFGGDRLGTGTLEAGDIFIGGDGSELFGTNNGTFYGGDGNDFVGQNSGTFVQ